MDASPEQNSLNYSSTVNLNQVCPAGIRQLYTQPALYNSVPNPYICNPMVPHSNHSCIYVPYLDSIAVTNVNMNCLPSQDTSGKDLPEINTLRFFYNLGVENYRSITQPARMWSTMPMSPMMHPGGIIATEQLSNNISGQFSLPPPPIHPPSSPQQTVFYQSGPQTVNFASQACCNFEYNPRNSTSVTVSACPESLPSSGTSPSKSDITMTTDELADNNDSGCDSDSISGSAHEDSFKESKDTKSCISENHSEETNDKCIEIGNKNLDASSETDLQVSNIQKNKGKKYYMYGNLKLVKPIKDIPPKFLSLLSILSAEKSRCQGDPIIIPFLPPRPKSNKQQIGAEHSVNSSATTTFNPEAKCFVPGKSAQSVIHDPSIVACSVSSSSSSSGGGDREQNLPTVTFEMYSNPNKANDCMYTHCPGLWVCSNSAQSLSQLNHGNGTLCNITVASNNHSNTNLGDGCQYSMPPCFSTGQLCPTYPAVWQGPAYHACSGSFGGAQPFNPHSGPGPYQACSMQPQALHMHSMQTAPSTCTDKVMGY